MNPALYAVICRVREEQRVTVSDPLNVNVKEILNRSGLLPELRGSKSRITDTRNTTIPFATFEKNQEQDFHTYLTSHVTAHRKFPAATDKLKQRIADSITELYSNANLHSRCKHLIASCGQFFPNKNKLEFCVADAGIGISGSVKRYELGMSDCDCIKWALESGNTTKTGSIPGGVGLDLVKKFTQLNGGTLIIVSGTGFYSLTGDNEPTVKTLPVGFPGTVINLAFNTDDQCYYRLGNEAISPEYLF